MRKSVAPLLAAASLVASTADAAPVAIPPILTGAPSAAAINARCNWFVKQSTTMRTALERSKAKPSVTTTLAAYDKISELLSAGSGEVGFYRQVSPTAASRGAGEKCEVRIASEQTKLSLSRPIYEHLKAIPAPAHAPTKLYLGRVLSAFERAGIALDAAGRAKAQALSEPPSKRISPRARRPSPRASPSSTECRRTSSPRTSRDPTVRSRSPPTAPITCR